MPFDTQYREYCACPKCKTSATHRKTVNLKDGVVKKVWLCKQCMTMFVTVVVKENV